MFAFEMCQKRGAPIDARGLDFPQQSFKAKTRAMTMTDNHPLLMPTWLLMGEGGDDRITLDEQSGLNGYGCAPEPVRAISYSSSTASSVSAAAYAQAHTVHHQLRAALTEQADTALYGDWLRKASKRIRACYDLLDDVEIAFGPSGTDLEYLSLALAMASGQPVTNFVVEVDEVGSGCLFSQAGQYFAPRTALGLSVEKGAQLPGFDPNRVHVVTLKARSDDGPVRSEDNYATALLTLAGEVIAAGGRPLVHIIHRSKTGIITPTLPVIDRLLAVHGDAVDLVVDACQGRISPGAIAAYLDRGASIFVTGSKFIGGPPFSAWALVPPRLAIRMRSGAVPAGLGHFFAREEVPAAWTSCDDVLPPATNFGLLLRLEAGLFELERLLTLPMARIDAVIAAFGHSMRSLPTTAPFRLVEGAADDPAAGDHQGPVPHPLDRKMLYVIELTLAHPASGAALSVDQARDVYRTLYTDVSGQFGDLSDRLAAAEICHLGQPVKCFRLANGEWAPTLRLSLSAPQIFDMIGLDDASLAERFAADIDRIAAKIRLAIGMLAP